MAFDALVDLLEIGLGHHHQAFIEALGDEGAAFQQVTIARRDHQAPFVIEIVLELT
ncbi:MAG: hypothetical protein M0C28_44360 [Candidatus Moduliflexus flocculans]|nr:hypothetical protein [Candidatus Moduliflexus flocculans]